MLISEILILELYYTKTELNIYINSAGYSLEKIITTITNYHDRK